MHLVKDCPVHLDVSDGVKTGEISQFENRGRMQRFGWVSLVVVISGL